MGIPTPNGHPIWSGNSHSKIHEFHEMHGIHVLQGVGQGFLPLRWDSLRFFENFHRISRSAGHWTVCPSERDKRSTTRVVDRLSLSEGQTVHAAGDSWNPVKIFKTRRESQRRGKNPWPTPCKTWIPCISWNSWILEWEFPLQMGIPFGVGIPTPKWMN